MSFTFLNELPSPAQIQERYPLSEKLQELKKQRDAEISNVIKGLDNRFLVIIGPCSADNEDSVCDYVSRLTSIQENVKDKLIIIPRVCIQTNHVPPVKVTRDFSISQTRRRNQICMRA